MLRNWYTRRNMTVNTEEKNKEKYQMNEKLTKEQRKRLLKLSKDYEDIFAKMNHSTILKTYIIKLKCST